MDIVSLLQTVLFALLAIGTQKGQGDTYGAAAAEIFARIVNDYPDSDRVGEARRQLEKLRP